MIEARFRDSEDAVTLAKGGSAAFQVAGPGGKNDLESGVFLPNVAGVQVVSLEQAVPEPLAENGGSAL